MLKKVSVNFPYCLDHGRTEVYVIIFGGMAAGAFSKT